MRHSIEQKKYDVVAIYQTSFQKKIVDAVIEQYFPNRNITMFNIAGSILSFDDGSSLHTNLYGVRQISQTISSLKGGIPVINCADLIGSFITSYNGFLFPSIIQFKRLHLIDDGIGTPVIFKHPDYWDQTIKLKIKNYLLNYLLKFTLNQTLYYPSKVLADISSYFTIYPRSGIIDIRLKPLYMDFLMNRTIQQTVFIGQPVLEYHMVNRSKFVIILQRIVKQYGEIIYYLHPREKMNLKPIIHGVHYAFLKEILIEDFFKSNGLPENIFSFSSTTLLNLSMNIPRISLFYIRQDHELNTSKSISAEYYNILERNDVKEYL